MNSDANQFNNNEIESIRSTAQAIRHFGSFLHSLSMGWYATYDLVCTVTEIPEGEVFPDCILKRDDEAPLDEATKERRRSYFQLFNSQARQQFLDEEIKDVSSLVSKEEHQERVQKFKENLTKLVSEAKSVYTIQSFDFCKRYFVYDTAYARYEWSCDIHME